MSAVDLSSWPRPVTALHPLARWVGIGLTALLAACGGGGGGANGTPQTVGIDTASNAPNSGMRCVDGPPAQDGVNHFPNLFFPWQNLAGSCTIVTFSTQDPGVGRAGTVTSASIRVGPTTGRMRFVRLCATSTRIRLAQTATASAARSWNTAPCSRQRPTA